MKVEKTMFVRIDELVDRAMVLTLVGQDGQEVESAVAFRGLPKSVGDAIELFARKVNR